MVEQGFSKIITLSLIALAVVILITTAGVFLFQKTSNLAEAPKPRLLASVFNYQEEYDDVFLGLQKPAEDISAVAGIVSHHFLAKQLITDFYNNVGSEKVKTVFLLSPDHYNNYFKPGMIAYSSFFDWTTPFGILPTDKEKIKAVEEFGNTQISDSAMGLEHGIYVEIPFIKKFFPNAKIVPLVLKSNLPYGDFVDFGKNIKKIGGDDSVLIVSSDFSHNATTQQSSINDRKSISVLKDLNTENISEATSDCKQCLATLSGFLDGGKDNFYLLDNKNSFDISGQDKESVTSYVSGYYAKKDYVQILFIGDTMLDRGIRYYANKNNGMDFIFDKIYPTLSANDLVVANLEGPITDNKSLSAGSAIGSSNNYFFTFDPSVAKTLFENNIRLVDLGNNHVLNFGQNGLDSTKKYLTDANVDYFGVPNGERSTTKDISGIKIAFVGYNQFVEDKPEDVVNEIKKVKLQADLVFVFCHWGNEYILTASDNQKSLGHQFVDAGADLIIGSHPHVIEPMEKYNGKRIYYSLGNFIFDQYFSEDTRNGLGVEVKINKQTKSLEFSEKRFYMQTSGQTVSVP
jgi:poly-gamma-glutamate synthesis protein (capsule biosynthesis protein)